MSVLPVEEPSASFLAAARMRLQEALENTEQHRAWYHRFVFDPTAWLRQMRFSPALAAILVIVGFGGGLGAMYSAMGGARPATCRTFDSRRFDCRHYLHRSPAEFQ